jgi:hypothetical protein
MSEQQQDLNTLAGSKAAALRPTRPINLDARIPRPRIEEIPCFFR